MKLYLFGLDEMAEPEREACFAAVAAELRDCGHDVQSAYWTMAEELDLDFALAADERAFALADALVALGGLPERDTYGLVKGDTYDLLKARWSGKRVLSLESALGG